MIVIRPPYRPRAIIRLLEVSKAPLNEGGVLTMLWVVEPWEFLDADHRLQHFTYDPELNSWMLLTFIGEDEGGLTSAKLWCSERGMRWTIKRFDQ